MALALSMVLLREDADLAPADIERELAERWPDLPAATDAMQKDDTMALRVGYSDIILGKMPAPIPWSDLEGPCATSILWKNAAEEIRPHKVHWIVTVTREGSPLELATLLTQATAAMMAACPAALGVYWANATMVIPKNLFIDFAQKILPQGPPLHIWVDFRVGKDSKTTSAGFTTGMAALGHMELEVELSPEPPGELRERLMALAGYLLEKGPVIKDGDTIGEDDTERIRIVHAPSAFGHKEKVMRLQYEKRSSGQPW